MTACQFCKFEACVTCVKRYLLESVQGDPVCMNKACGKPWVPAFLHSILPKNFIKGAFKERREFVLWERESALMAATQPQVEIIQERRVREREVVKYKEEIEALRIRIIEIQMPRPRVAGEVANKASEFVFRCACRGFVSRGVGTDNHMCGLCKCQFCKACHVNIGVDPVKAKKQRKKKVGGKDSSDSDNSDSDSSDSSDEESEDDGDGAAAAAAASSSKAKPVKPPKPTKPHKCIASDIETVKLMISETKPCPGCSAPIFKISGCSQMFCTACKCIFDWNTGTVETNAARAHNPHYFAWLAERGTGEHGDELPDLPMLNGDENAQGCQGRYLDPRLLLPFLPTNNKHPLRIAILEFNQLISHMEGDQLRQYRPNHDAIDQINEDIRIRYLLNDIDEESFRAKAQMREKAAHKKRDIHDVLSAFSTAGRDILRNLIAKGKQHGGFVIKKRIDGTSCAGFETSTTTKAAVETLMEADTMCDFFSLALADIAKRYDCVVPSVLRYTRKTMKRLDEARREKEKEKGNGSEAGPSNRV